MYEGSWQLQPIHTTNATRRKALLWVSQPDGNPQLSSTSWSISLGKKVLWIFALGHCQTFESSMQKKEWQSMKGKWRGRGLAGTTVLNPDFKLIALFSASLLPSTLSADTEPRACLRIGGNQLPPLLKVSFYLAASSSVCFLSIFLPLLFFIQNFMIHLALPIFFASLSLFLLVLLFLYSVISGKNSTCMHVLSPSFGT